MVNAGVCKTSMRRFDSGCRLTIFNLDILYLNFSLSPYSTLIGLKGFHALPHYSYCDNFPKYAEVVKLANTQDLKSCGGKTPCGCESRPRHKVRKNVNQDFFQSWNSEMAYVLGYFTADGCLSISKERKKNPLTFNITSVDFEHLEKMSEVMGSNYKIGRKPNGSNKSFAFQIQIRNKKLGEDLMRLGLHSRKTYDLKPIGVPDEYFADFVRGFFDGDGSVYIYTVNHTPQIKIDFVCTSYDFLSDFNTKLCACLDIPTKSIHKQNREGKMTKYSICLYIEDAEKFSKFIYNDNPKLFLSRKKEVFEKWNIIGKTRRRFRKQNYPSKIGWRLSEGLGRIN